MIMLVPSNNMKIPNQVVEWFEKMKGDYEQSVQSVLDRFERNNTDQQKRYDQAMLENFSNLKQANKAQREQYDKQVSQLQIDVTYYKQQVAQQQQAIMQLNTRYDAVVSSLLIGNNKNSDIKDINSEDMLVESVGHKTIANDSVASKQIINKIMPVTSAENSSELNIPDKKLTDDLVPIAMEPANKPNKLDTNNTLFEQALLYRDENEFEQSFSLFEQAAQSGHLKAMGALCRSYFLGEGIEENHPIGLAWLIKAAEQELPQAVSKVQQFQENEPDLYQQALAISLE